MTKLYTTDEEIDELYNTLNTHLEKLTNHIYADTGNTDFSQNPKHVKIIETDLRHDLKHVIETLTFLKEMKNY